MSRVLLSAAAHRIAELRLQVGAAAGRPVERPVLVREIQIAVLHDRLGDEDIERLIAVDGHTQRLRNDERKHEQRLQRAASGRPSHLVRGGLRYKKERELHGDETDGRQPRIDAGHLRPDHRGQRVHGHVDGQPAAQGTAAQREERQDCEHDDGVYDQERHRRSSSTASICRRAARGSEGSAVTRYMPGWIGTRPAPSNHASCPYPRSWPAGSRGSGFRDA